MPHRDRWQHPCPADRQWLSLAQVAELSGESVGQLENWISQGKLPHGAWQPVWIDGRKRWGKRWRRGEIERRLAELRVQLSSPLFHQR